MNKQSNFAANLKNIQVASGVSLEGFAQRLGIPKSTLQYVLIEGQTSLDTAIRISDSLSLTLDALLNEAFTPQKLTLMSNSLAALDWFYRLSAENQRMFSEHLSALLRIIEENTYE